MDESQGGWIRWAEGELDAVRAAGRWRATRLFDAHGADGCLDGRQVTSFASNDYLGLSTHPEVVAAAHEAIDRWGTGATASRLIVGTRPCHGALEDELASWKRCERAIVFPTGYAANLGVLGVVGGPEVTVFSDELNHASIIDGCRLSRSRVQVFDHGDVEQLDRMLAAATTRRRVVVTDSVFSMDGDLANIDALVTVCGEHGALLVVDEAHAVLGPELPSELGGVTVLRVGTLSKTLGSLGGWVAGPAPIIDLLVNRARPYIFTTALSPADAAAALAAVRLVRGGAGEALIERLRAVVNRVRAGHPSPVIPVVLGDEGAALKASAALLEAGIFIPAIRPPTVPPETSRLRLALSAGHTDDMIDHLVSTLDALGLPR